MERSELIKIINKDSRTEKEEKVLNDYEMSIKDVSWKKLKDRLGNEWLFRNDTKNKILHTKPV